MPSFKNLPKVELVCVDGGPRPDDNMRYLTEPTPHCVACGEVPDYLIETRCQACVDAGRHHDYWTSEVPWIAPKFQAYVMYEQDERGEWYVAPKKPFDSKADYLAKLEELREQRKKEPVPWIKKFESLDQKDITCD